MPCHPTPKTTGEHEPPDLAALRRRLAHADGEDYWHTLHKLADTPAFAELLRRELPALAALWETPLQRRSLLKFAAAGLALAGITGCQRQPVEKIVPYVHQPEAVVPGKPLYFATALTLGGYARGVLVESHTGRPTKVEGNPLHPASLGATDVWAQAACLELYDPDRSQAMRVEGRPGSWDRLLGELTARRRQWRQDRGRGLALLTPNVTSPTLVRQLRGLLDEYPQARWYRQDDLGRDNVLQGARRVYGRPLEPTYRLDQASVVLALDGDFLYGLPGAVRYARDFTDRRRLWQDPDDMNRLYAVEGLPTLTGAMADHRKALRSADMEGFTRHLARRLGLEVDPGPAPPGVDAHWLDVLVRDLQANTGAAVVIPGDHLPPAVHGLVHAINHHLGAIGNTVEPRPPVVARPPLEQDLTALNRAIRAGEVDSLVILGGDPVYTAPRELELADTLQQLDFSLHWGLYRNPTARACRWHVPAAHELESWGDARAYDGTVSIRQPLILPLFGGRSDHELLAALGGRFGLSDRDIVRTYWQEAVGDDFETFWHRALHDGLVPDSAAPVLSPGAPDLAGLPPTPPPGQGLELRFAPDPRILDGRFGNLGWLQELPKPLTSLVWGNAALMAPALAGRLGVEQGDWVELAYGGKTLTAPAYVLPGHADGQVSLYLGYGQQLAGRMAEGMGVDAYRLRRAEAPWFDTGLELHPLAPRSVQVGGVRIHPSRPEADLVQVQQQFRMHDRPMVRHADLETFRANPDFLHDEPHEKPPEHSLYPEWDYSDSHAWGMSIDLTACMGCNACTIACQAENNIPTVGRDEVAAGHEMHWIRVDTYYEGPEDEPEAYFQPVPCMHCEKAPCEYVCPVMATVHDHEGLNVQVYNRCIGTRDCSQNCPYKVRRFNWHDYNQREWEQAQAPLHNPDVTVRSRGVMEKCTYCLQRISQTRIEAKRENRPIRDGELLTACQQACPTQAIVFGDLNDPGAKVKRLKDSPLDYALLAELNTRPRTTYLARIRNPHPDLAGEGGEHG